MKTIILIGIAASGKSTLGRALAQKLRLEHIDIDYLMEAQLQCSLQKFMEKEGHLALRQVEEDFIVEYFRDKVFENTVVSTGGSVVYSARAMRVLQKIGVCIYLEISDATFIERLNNRGSNGLASAATLSLSEIYAERMPLYEKYANTTLRCEQQSIEQTLIALQQLVENVAQGH